MKNDSKIIWLYNYASITFSKFEKSKKVQLRLMKNFTVTWIFYKILQAI